MIDNVHVATAEARRANGDRFIRAFVKVSDCLQQGIDRHLGYHGDGRFVLFYYEPRGEEVMWNDGTSYGFAAGGWRVYLEDIEPLGERYGVCLGGDGGRPRHGLLLDRARNEAWFAELADASAFVSGLRGDADPA